jgi:hypothetical protein
LFFKGRLNERPQKAKRRNQNLPSDWGRVRQLRQCDNSGGRGVLQLQLLNALEDNMLMRKDIQPPV